MWVVLLLVGLAMVPSCRSKIVVIVDGPQQQKKFHVEASSVEEFQMDLTRQLLLPAPCQIRVYDPLTQQYTQTLDNPAQLERRNIRVSIISEHEEVELMPASRLALPSSKSFPIDFAQEGLKIGDQYLFITEVGNSGQGTGLNIWDGSVVLAKYLEQAIDLHGKNVLELGSGTGLVGIAASLLGAPSVILTDLKYTLENLNHNIDLNKEAIKQTFGATVVAKELDWFSDEAVEFARELDLILASDVVWVEELITPLVKTMKKLCQQSTKEGIHILMSYQSRSSSADKKLMKELEQNEFHVTSVDTKSYHPKYNTPKIKIYHIQTKK